MGRRKKSEIVTEIVEEQSIKNNKEETKKKDNFEGMNIGYQGKIKVSIMCGKKVISSKVYHNRGTKKLFQFICEALAGNYRPGLRPMYIRAFTNDELEEAMLPDTYKFNEDLAVTPYIMYETTAFAGNGNAEDGESTTDTYSVVYTFKIPYAFISGTKISKVALYPQNRSNANTDKCAFYGFVNPDTNDWDSIDLEQGDFLNGNFCIVMEWKMTLSNFTKSEV